MLRIISLLFVMALSACATREKPDPAYYEIDAGHLPRPDVTLNIPGLGPCTDNPDRSLHLDSSQPVNVLVHGCFGSSGNFRGLAQVLAFHGQQTACFTYDDRAGLTHSATELRHALNLLAEQTRAPQITLIGHSQGALISRKSLADLPLAPPRPETDLRLVTVSGPFDGIAAAKTCGRDWLNILSLGLLPATCQLVTGSKWSDITFSSRFIRQPGTLTPGVSRYLKIDTDERGSCRRFEGSRCVESDDIFSVAEQRNQRIEADARTQRLELRAGHVEIVGDKRVAPVKLIAALQEQGILKPTPSAHAAAFRQLLARVYQDDSFMTWSTPESRPQP
ncbi:alpha/beta hydrolase [Uliginosibacterium sp. 31-16]|uniref:esterase/lipase family protein n=1 Tax=Uliginosibacterium sp. 31-16 TaxID=3068315 RepID=UPI00273D7223|nr:alpha/beta fold hydrolase [Uliginosibacterium sp. 31-16]MDP5238471.1 alpha/beta hydrolase [Uliginosibacterium sp. 31-16]